MRRTGDNTPHLPSITDAALPFTSLSEAVGANLITAQPLADGGGCFDAIWPFLRGREKGSRSDTCYPNANTMDKQERWCELEGSFQSKLGFLNEKHFFFQRKALGMHVLLITISESMCENKRNNPTCASLCSLLFYLPPFCKWKGQQGRGKAPKPEGNMVTFQQLMVFLWPVLLFHKKSENNYSFLVEEDYCRLSCKSQLVHVGQLLL